MGKDITFLHEMQKHKTYEFEKISKYTYENAFELFDGFTPLFTFTIYYDDVWDDECNHCFYKYHNNMKIKVPQNSCYCDNREYFIANIIVSAVGNPIKTNPHETIFKIDFISAYCLKSEMNNIFYRSNFKVINDIHKRTIFSLYNSMDENDEISKNLVDKIFNKEYASHVERDKINEITHKKHHDLHIYGNFFHEFNGKESREKYYSCFIDIIKNILQSKPQTETKENPHIGMKRKIKI